MTAADGWDGVLGVEADETTSTRVVAHVDIDERHLQPYGIVHGGVYAALAESLTSAKSAGRSARPVSVPSGSATQASGSGPPSSSGRACASPPGPAGADRTSTSTESGRIPAPSCSGTGAAAARRRLASAAWAGRTGKDPG